MASRDYRSTLIIDPAKPVAARHLRWTIELGREAVWGVHFWVAVASPAGAPAPDVHVTIVPEQRGLMPYSDETAHRLDLTNACRRRCRSGATVVVRLAETSGEAVSVDLDAGIAANGSSETPTLDVAMSLEEDEKGRTDGVPAGPIVEIRRPIRVSMARPEASDSVALHVSGDALTPPVGLPLVGSFETWVRTLDARGHPNAHETTVTIGDGDPLWLHGDSAPAQPANWLDHCTAGRDCEVPVRLQSFYDATIGDPDDRDVDNFVELEWVVEARLDALDGRALLADALSLAGD